MIELFSSHLDLFDVVLHFYLLLESIKGVTCKKMGVKSSHLLIILE